MMKRKMKAAVLEATGRLEVNAVGVPPCPEGGLLVKTQACSICTTDAKMYRHGQRDLTYPRIPGHEFSGIIEESRTGKDSYEPGQRVQVAPGINCGICSSCRRGHDNRCSNIEIFGFNRDGGFAEYVLIPETSVLNGGVNHIPDNTSFEDAALTEPLASCINAQDLVGMGQGDSVLILGAEPTGLLHAELARTRGASLIIIAERLENRLEMARNVGADFVINLNQNNLSASVLEVSNGAGVGVIIPACREEALESLLELTSPGGRVCLFSGLPHERERLKLNANLIHYRETSVTGAYGCTHAQNRTALDLISTRRIDVSRVVTCLLPPEEIREGLLYTERREGLKAVIKF